MSSSNKKGKEKQVPFPVGVAGRVELRNELKATTNPAKTIREFQESHSLHTMMAKAFNTVPISQFRETRRNSTDIKESLDTDSVMTFLSHLGVNQHEVHKRISDTLLKQLDEEIRKTNTEEPLLELLQSCWTYATTIVELRPVLWAVLKQLGSKIPLAVLITLSERDTSNNNVLKHAEVYQPLPANIKRLVWEADWENRISITNEMTVIGPAQLLEQMKPTLLFETIEPIMKQYTTNKLLCDSANRPFVATLSERRIITTQRRALAKTGTTASTTPSGSSTAAANTLTSGKAVSHLRSLLCDSTYRPKLLYATLSILMAQHGTTDKDFLGGAEHLNCTLVADLLLSAGGPLPKAYANVLSLARILDDAVQEGNISDPNLVKIQATLKLIFQLDETDTSETSNTDKKAEKDGSTTKDTKNDNEEKNENSLSTATQRQLNRIITSGLNAMKDADPQQLFLNPVTDAIAPGYSKIISKPMSIVTMEEKVASNEYSSVMDWNADVKLMFKNCIDYNRGNAGQWFRGEANRQGKVFREEIYPQAHRLYQSEVAKRSNTIENETDENNKKRKESTDNIEPLQPATKKRKKEKEEYLPSMPAIATMLLSDPFVVRIVLARILRELRRGVLSGSTLPLAHSSIPSLIQLLHIARWSKQVCAVKGKKYFIPGAGLEEGDDPSAIISHASLRKFLPLILQITLEAELDRRIAQGGDLHQASQSASSIHIPSIDEKAWDGNDQVQVALSFLQGSLVHICYPGNRNETSLATTFPKFATALQRMFPSLHDERTFFICINLAILRHKTKLPKPTRDTIIRSWLLWLKRKGAMNSAAHECLIEVLNDWSTFGNVLLPRDNLIAFTKEVVETINTSEKKEARKFAAVWKKNSPKFSLVKKQYERMLKSLPETLAKQWAEEIGIEWQVEEGKNKNENKDEEKAS